MTFTDLSQWFVDFVAAYPYKYSQIAIWREPIVACAPADDRFNQLKEITVADHAFLKTFCQAPKRLWSGSFPLNDTSKQIIRAENVLL
jgi:hypothetical protein